MCSTVAYPLHVAYFAAQPHQAHPKNCILNNFYVYYAIIIKFLKLIWAMIIVVYTQFQYVSFKITLATRYSRIIIYASTAYTNKTYLYQI